MNELIDCCAISFVSKSGHHKMRTPIMLCFKAKGVHIAPPGNPYYVTEDLEYSSFSFIDYRGENDR